MYFIACSQDEHSIKETGKLGKQFLFIPIIFSLLSPKDTDSKVLTHILLLKKKIIYNLPINNEVESADYKE